MLDCLTVGSFAGQEDPALTIMRRAISKVNYHRLQVQEYSMMVYIKRNRQLTDAPFFKKKKLEEKGMGLNETFTSKSLSQISFKQPYKVEEKVISIRPSGEQNRAPPLLISGRAFITKGSTMRCPDFRSAFPYYRCR